MSSGQQSSQQQGRSMAGYSSTLLSRTQVAKDTMVFYFQKPPGFHMGIALLAGGLLAKQKRYTAHGICQTAVLLLNLLMIALVMWPSFHQQVGPVFPRMFRKRYYTVATIHAALGMVAEILGLYIIMVAGTNILPQQLCFKRWKLWMRAELILWSIVLLSGVGTYYVWYIAPLS
jgi:uncharacterized membrane protein YozB (DUF420 family)